MAGTNFQKAVTTTLTAEFVDSFGLITKGFCTGTPPTTAGTFIHGAIITQTDTADTAKSTYENTGTTALPVWNLMGDATVGEITLTTGSVLIGAAGVGSALDVKTSGQIMVGNGTTATSVAVSGDATLASTGVVTVSGATGAFNIGTNMTWTKEVAHIETVSDSTTANTAGAAYTMTGAKGTGTAAGGALNFTTGASTNGTAVSPGASGAYIVTVGAAGTATTGTAGAAGAITFTGAAGGASTGAASTAGAGTTVTFTAGAGGASSGGSDTAGAGGNIVMTAGNGGSGATPGRDGMFFRRGAGYAQKVTVTALTTSATLVTQQMMAGMFTANQGGGAAATYTTPIGSVMAGILPVAFTTGDSFDFTITNISTNASEDVTVAAGVSGITLFGNMVVASNAAATDWSVGTFRVVCSGASTYNIYRIA